MGTDAISGTTVPQLGTEPPPAARRERSAAPAPERLVDVEPERSGSDMRQAVDDLIRAWLDGRDVILQPVPVMSLPADALNSERAVARFAAIVKGLQLGAAVRMPILLGRVWVAGWFRDPRMAEACGLERAVGERQIGFIRANLETWGVLVPAGEVRINGRGKPAKLYELGAVVAGGNAEVARRRGQQPRNTDVQDPLVATAEDEGPIGPLAAAGDFTGDGS